LECALEHLGQRVLKINGVSLNERVPEDQYSKDAGILCIGKLLSAETLVIEVEHRGAFARDKSSRCVRLVSPPEEGIVFAEK
jgi:hypothetical protein